MSGRGRLRLVAAVAALVLPAPAAQAADFCVNVAGCPVPQPTVQAALAAAEGAAGPDRVVIGVGTYTAPTTAGFAYNGTAPVEVIGIDETATTLTGPNGTSSVLTFGSAAAGSSVRDLAVRIPASSPGSSTGIQLSGMVERVTIGRAAPQTQPGAGIRLDAGTAKDVTVDLTTGAQGSDAAIQVGGGTIAVVDGSLTAASGVTAVSGGTAVVDRTRVTATTTGFEAAGGTIHARNSLVTTQGNAVGVAALTQPNQDGVVVADHLTLVGDGAGIGVRAGNAITPARFASVTLRNSIVRGYAESLRRNGFAPGSASILADTNDYDASAGKVVESGPGTLFSEGQTFTAGPLFTGPTYELAADSALVEAASDASPPTPLDLAGAPRTVDADGDCTAQRDLGAFEVQAGPWPACTPTPPPPADTAVPGPPTSATAPPEVARPPLPPAVARDRTAPRIGRLSVRRLKGGRARVRFTLSEAATVTVRAAGRTKRLRARKGTVSTTVRLRRGKVTVTAADAAGNRATKRATIR